uniref:Uncharacterized protein n=1 Tax=Buteo japonicus TaxID=224669 RepID=A0A8C0ARU2_9AVES
MKSNPDQGGNHLSCPCLQMPFGSLLPSPHKLLKAHRGLTGCRMFTDETFSPAGLQQEKLKVFLETAESSYFALSAACPVCGQASHPLAESCAPSRGRSRSTSDDHGLFLALRVEDANS